MPLRTTLPLSLFASTLTLAAQSQNSVQTTGFFDLHIAGKFIGHNTYTLSRSSKGYKLASHLTASLHNTDLDFKDAFTYSETYAYIDGSQTSQAANQQISYLPDKASREMTIAVAVAGRTSSTVEPIGPNLLLLPPFDAGAAQALLLHCVLGPTPDNPLQRLSHPRLHPRRPARPRPNPIT